MKGSISILACLLGLSLGCGSDGVLEFDQVAGIPSGNGAGEALTGTFTVLFKVTSDGCATSALLEVPAANETENLEVEITHNDGAIRLKKVDGVDLRGGITFENDFDVGGAEVQGRGGEEGNFLSLVHLTGRFQDANSFTGSGRERLQGRIDDEYFDCSFSFDISGIRKD